LNALLGVVANAAGGTDASDAAPDVNPFADATGPTPPATCTTSRFK
jgi:hypothetical protein